MEKNYYDEKIQEIKSLKNEKKYVEASGLINEELRMPYIPEKYEVVFNDLAIELNSLLTDKIENTALTEAQIIEHLNSGDKFKIGIAVENLSKVNLRTIQKDLVLWISKHGSEDKVARNFIYESLVDQEINTDLVFDGVKLNPSKDGSIIRNKEILKVLSQLESLTQKEPSLFQTLQEVVYHYVLNTWPKVRTYDKSFAGDILLVTRKMFDPTIELTEVQKQIAEILK